MSDKQDEKLDAMLRSRRFESASPDLAQRIILKVAEPAAKSDAPSHPLAKAVVCRVSSS